MLAETVYNVGIVRVFHLSVFPEGTAGPNACVEVSVALRIGNSHVTPDLGILYLDGANVILCEDILSLNRASLELNKFLFR